MSSDSENDFDSIKSVESSKSRKAKNVFIEFIRSICLEPMIFLFNVSLL